MADIKSAAEGYEISPVTPSFRTISDLPVENGDQIRSLGEVREEAQLPARGRFRITMILVALFLSLFLAALDSTIVATAIPTIAADLHSASGYTWIGGAYLIANAAAAPIWGKLSDIWGRKPILLVAVAIFMAGSIVCARAGTMGMLIVGRSIQGAAGGGLILLVNITISDIFSMRRRSLFLGLCEAIWAIAGGAGPILGGVLTDLVSWRYCWWINLPTSGVAFVILLLFLDVHNPKTPIQEGLKAIDWAGVLSMLALTLMILLGLDFGGNTYPWSSSKVICLLVFGALCSLFFIYAEKRLAKYPLVPLGLFKERSNVAAVLVCFFHGMVFFAGEYYLPLYFQSVKGATPLKSGLYVIPLMITTAVCGVLVGVIIHKTGRYQELMWIGTVLMTVGSGLYINLGADSTVGQFVGFEIVTGIGAGLLFEPPLIALQAGVAQDDIATATSTLSFIREMALAISVIIGGVVFQNSMDNRESSLRAAGVPSNVVELLSGTHAAANVKLGRTLPDAGQRLAVRKAFAFSIRNLWIMYCCLGFCSVISGIFVIRRNLSKEHSETITGLKKQSVDHELGNLT